MVEHRAADFSQGYAPFRSRTCQLAQPKRSPQHTRCMNPVLGVVNRAVGGSGDLGGLCAFQRLDIEAAIGV